MKTLRSYVCGSWHEAADGFATLINPTTEEPIARTSTAGIDFQAVLDHARSCGGPNLRAMTFIERGKMLKAAADTLHEAREELISMSIENTGCTRRDAKFDIGGATATLSYYGYLATELGNTTAHAADEAVNLGRSARFMGRHVRVPLAGAAVHINAFNFPAWGFAEKAAVAWLAGMPVITKPATSTAMVTERCVELLIDAKILPEGSFQLIAGSTGDLLTRLGSQDVFSFTGSADTALMLRSLPNLLSANTRVNLEADSLNAAVLGPDVESGSETLSLFYADVLREMTQKSGQKCTAVRRIFVPADRLDEVRDEMISRLADVVVGDPASADTAVGPLTTPRQLEDAISGVRKLSTEAKIVFGTGERVGDKGCFFGPVLLQCDDPQAAEVLHRHEVFGPVATLMPYDGTATAAAGLVSRSDGTLVVSVYSDDEGFVSEYLKNGGCFTGRLYLGSEKMASQAPGSGVAMPQCLHGGPGRAGGGGELGALAGLDLYTQKVSLQGSRKMLLGLAEPSRPADKS